MTLPNFLIVGAAKSGTTSLYYGLKQHPEVYTTPGNEPNFFALEGEKLDFRAPGSQNRINRWSITDIDAYQALYAGASKEKALGEKSPLYLYSPQAPLRIKHYVPEARLLVVLRHPADRAYSSFLHLVRNGREPLKDFGAALREEETRIRDNWEWIWHYKNMGFYHEQLRRYYDTFERGQIRVYLHEELNGDPVSVLRDAYGFLGIDTSFTPDMSLKYNMSGVPKNQFLFDLIKRPNLVKSVLKPMIPEDLRRRASLRLQHRFLAKPPFPREERERLVADYKEDILKLQDLIGRDLSAWLG